MNTNNRAICYHCKHYTTKAKKDPNLILCKAFQYNTGFQNRINKFSETGHSRIYPPVRLSVYNHL